MTPADRAPLPDALRTVRLDADILRGDPLNPRHNEHAIAPIAENIRRYGFTAPVIARPDPDRPEGAEGAPPGGGLVVIAGHTRLAAAASAGVEAVPVHVLDVTEAEGRALMLSDNKLGELATWNDDGLAAILADLDADDTIDLGDLGWSDVELAELLGPEVDPPGGEGSGGQRGAALAGHIERHPVEVIEGECVAVLDGMPAKSVDAVLTDPPYGIGFMGEAWDGDLDFAPKWAAALFRVCKPGAHVLAFGADRKVHRLAVALEDAGFEIRHQISWLHWGAFPAGSNIGKAIDRMRHDREQILQVTSWVRAARKAAGITNADIDAAFGLNGMAGHWTSTASQPSVPTLDQWPALLAVLGVAEADVPPEIARLAVDLNSAKGEPGPNWDKREVVGTVEGWTNAEGRIGPVGMSGKDYDVTLPATEAAARWEGWHTRLRPIVEPIVLARRPFEGGATAAANCLAWGVGALNIDATRHPPGDPLWPGPNGANPSVPVENSAPRPREIYNLGPGPTAHEQTFGANHPLGRYPGNVVTHPRASTTDRDWGLPENYQPHEAGVMGSAGGSLDGRARPTNRNDHVSVKPIGLMRHLAKLICPPGGHLLDTFAGSGSAGIAACAEGMRATLIERDPHFVEISRIRCAAAMTLPSTGGKAISRAKLSAPAAYALDEDMIRGRVLDYGSGRGGDVERLRKVAAVGLTDLSAVEAYDPNHGPTESPIGPFDTILCTYVLNVVDLATEADILRALFVLLAPGGRALISVRRDLDREADGATAYHGQRWVDLAGEDLPIVEENASFCMYLLADPSGGDPAFPPEAGAT